MKKLILAVLAATTFFALSGCGDDNYIALYPTKANLTFAVMSSSITAQDPAFHASSLTGVKFVQLAAVVPDFCNISSTASAGPSQTGVTASPVLLPTALPAGATRISASALVKAGPFANISTVSKRTKLTGYFVHDLLQQTKNIRIFLVYSSAAGAAAVTGNSIDFSTLTVSYPAGRVMTGDVFKDINMGLWTPNITNSGGLVGFYNSTPALTNTVPTVSQAILGF